MTDFGEAIRFISPDPMLSLFVIWPPGTAGALDTPDLQPQPIDIARFDLEGSADQLDGRMITAYDFTYAETTTDFQYIVVAWLGATIRAGAYLAWFAFEGSFSFDHILTAGIATQVYGVAAGDAMAIAVDESARTSEGWAAQLSSLRKLVA